MIIRRYWRGGLRRPLVLVMVVLVAEIVLVAAVASAQGVDNTPTTILVSNHDQRDPDGFLPRRGTVFQGFTTGGNPGGYELSEVGVVLLEPPPVPPDTEDVHERPRSLARADAPEYRVEIWSEKGIIITMPGQKLYTLNTPTSVPLDEEVAFIAPADAVLDPNTSYYVRIIGATQVAWDMDREVDEDTAGGWSLHTGLTHQSEGGNAYSTYVPNAIIAVRGTAR